ncbi:hypothetical protein F441_00610 [Phytophthora nicotianae CJ01A1]|uniref:Uncharacterized protein n=6 Tax=Phytophthora nicotianae TaxID=4792 RepID=W2RF29_PHYN3|nr:hypothetical protein PPTG_20753 [Phytophthora nicotianae INRA-310]ETI57009.1 hypothetical protein F443_00626 [Phytophthora nicotianae P1569]ETK96784.1 hypothetical protein L915_00577 [Phytophthora nicotianae]ETO85761.1 hypothetical protein F444_00613 [Phytophthora nicotianae P1976]ETP26787.1 hypothetical protein F441_00610 [Phytophthora nicotianae CJ01A1]ETP27881.1 hypothetical protein F442_22831 [Phytophthora nicotianae P10297]
MVQKPGSAQKQEPFRSGSHSFNSREWGGHLVNALKLSVDIVYGGASVGARQLQELQRE